MTDDLLFTEWENWDTEIGFPIDIFKMLQTWKCNLKFLTPSHTTNHIFGNYNLHMFLILLFIYMKSEHLFKEPHDYFKSLKESFV